MKATDNGSLETIDYDAIDASNSVFISRGAFALSDNDMESGVKAWRRAINGLEVNKGCSFIAATHALILHCSSIDPTGNMVMWVLAAYAHEAHERQQTENQT